MLLCQFDCHCFHNCMCYAISHVFNFECWSLFHLNVIRLYNLIIISNTFNKTMPVICLLFWYIVSNKLQAILATIRGWFEEIQSLSVIYGRVILRSHNFSMLAMTGHVITYHNCMCYAISHVFSVKTSRPRQNGHHFPDDIFKYIFFNETILILIKI